MSLPFIQFPHIPRFISATALFLLLWGGFGLVLAANGISLPLSPTALAYMPILRNPLSSETHTSLAQTLWNSGKDAEAKHEANLAEDLNGGAVLGIDSPTTLRSQWESEPLRLAQELDHWNRVTNTHPDYRDGFIMAAFYAYQLGNTKEAHRLIEEAIRLDPTSPTALEIQAILE